jgi:O-antigen ligase
MFSYEAVNIPKSMVVIIGASVAATLLIHRKFIKVLKTNKSLFWLCFLMLIHLFAVFFFSGSSLVEQFYGADSRFVGLAAYASLVILLVYAYSVSSGLIISKILVLMRYLGLISSLYGLLQWLGADPVNWSNQYSPVMGFFGNPNHQSSFLGMCSVAVISEIVSSGNKLARKVLYFGLAVLHIFVIFGTESIQGFIVFIIGSAAVIFLKIRSTIWKSSVSGFYLFFVSVLAFTGITGMLNHGPLSQILHKNSVIYRGDYWRAAIRIVTEHPIFGVGFDQFGDWYRRYRDIEAVNRRGPEVVSNSPHNIFLDYAVSGGIILGLLYVGLVVITFMSALTVIKQSKSYDVNFSFVFSVWIAYQAQSLISVNQVGLTIWGWIFSGLLIGYRVKLKNSEGEKPLKKGLEVAVKQKISPIALLTGLTIGLCVSLPLFIKDVQLRSALEKGTVQQTIQAAEKWPVNANRAAQISSFLLVKGFPSDALTLARFSVENSPRSFVGWKTIYDSPSSSEQEKINAKRMLIELDPLNPSLK